MYMAEYYIKQDSYDSDFTSCECWSNPAVDISTILVVISWQKRPWSVHRNSLKIRHWDCKLVATLNLTSNVIIIKFDIKVISGFLNYWNCVCVYKYTHSQVSHTKWIWFLHILYLKKNKLVNSLVFLGSHFIVQKGERWKLQVPFQSRDKESTIWQFARSCQ